MLNNMDYYIKLQERRKVLAEQLSNLDAEIAETVGIIETAAKEQGNSFADIWYDNYHAYFKPGRKSTDHEAAATWASVSQAIIDEYSTTKVTVAWAKVTKAAKVNVEHFTVEAPPVFVIEEI